MVEGRTLWELVEARAEATPDGHRSRRRARRRSLTFAPVPRPGRAGRRRVPRTRRRRRATSCRGSCPTWLESLVLVAALSRLGAIQNPILPIYRAREVSFITEQAGSPLLVVPPVWRDFDFEAMANDDRRRPGRPRGRWWSTGSCPTAIRHGCRRAPAAPDDPADLDGALVLLHLRDHRRPEGRPAHRHDDRRRGPRDVRGARGHRGRPDRVRVPVHPHRRRGLRLQRHAVRVHDDRRRGLRRPDHAAAARGQRRDPGRRRHARSTWRTSPTNASTPSRRPLFPEARAYIGGGAPKPPQAPPRRQGRARRRRHRLGLRHDRGADRHHGVGARRATRSWPTPRGQARARHRPPPGRGRRDARRGPGRRGRDPAEGADAHAGLRRRHRRTPRPSTRTATSAPATSAGSTPTAT